MSWRTLSAMDPICWREQQPFKNMQNVMLLTHFDLLSLKSARIASTIAKE